MPPGALTADSWRLRPLESNVDLTLAYDSLMKFRLKGSPSKANRAFRLDKAA
jgi:hypothetical protein